MGWQDDALVEEQTPQQSNNLTPQDAPVVSQPWANDPIVDDEPVASQQQGPIAQEQDDPVINWDESTPLGSVMSVAQGKIEDDPIVEPEPISKSLNFNDPAKEELYQFDRIDAGEYEPLSEPHVSTGKDGYYSYLYKSYQEAGPEKRQQLRDAVASRVKPEPESEGPIDGSDWGMVLPTFSKLAKPKFSQVGGGLMRMAGESENPYQTTIAGDVRRIQGDDPKEFMASKAKDWLAEKGAALHKKGSEEYQKVMKESGIEENTPEWYALKTMEALGYDIGPMIAGSVVTGNPALPLMYVGSMVAGTEYGSLREEGRSRGEALGAAVSKAGFEFVTSKFELARILGRSGKGVIKGAVGGFIDEGAQEALAEAFSMAYDKGILSKEEDLTWGEALARVGQAGLIGGLAGSVVGGGLGKFGKDDSDGGDKESKPEIKPEPEKKTEEAVNQDKKVTPDDFDDFGIDDIVENDGVDQPPPAAAGEKVVDEEKVVEPEEEGPEPVQQEQAEYVEPERVEAAPAPEIEPEPVQQEEAKVVEPEVIEATPAPAPEEVAAAAHESATSPENDLPEPTEAQIEAGNYKKGHVKIHGLDVSIENPQGSERSGTDTTGKPWKRKLKDHYGYVKGTDGADGDQVDVFIGDNTESDRVFVIDQIDPKSEKFDEHKAMVGYADQAAAEEAYARNYDKKWKGKGAVTEMSTAEFKEWLNGDTKKPLSNDILTEDDVALIESFASQAGWSERGGKIIRENGLEGDVIGKTKWVPHQPWFQEMVREAGITVSDKAGVVRGAAKRLAKGRKLTLNQRRAVDWIRDHVREMEALETEEAEARGDTSDDAFYADPFDPEYFDDFLDAGLDPESEIDAADQAMVNRAAEIDEEAYERAAIKHVNDDKAFLKAVREINDEHDRNRKAVSSDTQKAKDSDAKAVSGKPEHEAEAQEQKEGLTLEAQAAPEPEPEKPASQPDLLGDDVAAQQAIADAKRAKDEKRSPGTDVPAGVDGGLFSDAQKQADIEDAKPIESTAPEHAQVGVNDRELEQVVAEFKDVHNSMFEDGWQMHHLFDEPGKSEVVRLNDKVKAYHKDHGWMTPKEAKAKIQEWKDHAQSQGGPDNSSKVVLSLFDLSGEWAKPWVEAGYTVITFDIQDNPEWGDINNFSHEFFADYFGDFEGADVYAILAACPCTDFASSGSRHFAAKDEDGRTVASVDLVHQTMATIEYFKPQVWAVENPVGRIEKLTGLPPWRMSFDPFHFGEDYTKKTLIWGRFNGDLPIAPTEPTEGSKMHRKYGGKSLATKNARSVTPEGFAYSFFMANNAQDHPVMALHNKYDRLDKGLFEKAVEAGYTKHEIESAIDDHYYMDLDDSAANAALAELVSTSDEVRQQAKEIGVKGWKSKPISTLKSTIYSHHAKKGVEEDERSTEDEAEQQALTIEAEPATPFQEAAGRSGKEVLAEYNRAKGGKPVTLVHRTPAVITELDDGKLGGNTSTPAGHLGHYMSAEDVGSPDRYGDNVNVFSTTLKNPLVLGYEAFGDIIADKSAEEVKQLRSDLIEQGHDAIAVDGYGWVILLEGKNAINVPTNAKSVPKPKKAKGPAYVLPEKSPSVDWRNSLQKDFVPDDRQKMVMDEVAKSLDDGKFYANDIYDVVTKSLGIPKELLSKNIEKVERGDVGMDIYYARKAVEAQRNRAKADDLSEKLSLKVGDKLGILVDSGGKRVTSAEIVSVDDGIYTVRGKRGRSVYEYKADANGIAGMVRKAHERGKRKTGVDDLIKDRSSTKPAEKIEDFGEKIGGARKDTAVATGPKRRRKKDSRPTWAKRFEINEIVSSTKEEDIGKWQLSDKRKTDFMGNPRKIATFDSEVEAQEALPVYAVGMKHRPVMRADGDRKFFEIYRTVTQRKRVKVVDKEFDTREDAMKYMALNAAEILETKTGFGEEILPLPEKAGRTGAKRRDGDATKEMFVDEFGFRGVEFGKWNNQDERQQVMNYAYDSFMDMAEAIGVPPRALSLDGDIGIAFGARGQGLSGARAHYEPEYAVINLTKMSGAGALAHEWFHALDNYFARQDGKSPSTKIENKRGDKVYEFKSDRSGFVSHGFGFKSNVRDDVQAAYKDLIETMFKRAEEYVEDSSRAESFLGRARELVENSLKGIRETLAADLSDRAYVKRKKKPANAEQLAQFDALAKRIMDGEEFESRHEQKKNSRSFRMVNDATEEIAALMKEVRGRTGYGSGKGSGSLDYLRGHMNLYQERIRFMAEADKGEKKTRKRPTDFAMQAKEMDQGRTGDYWMTPHEMAARAFQAYIEDNLADSGAENSFLSYGSKFGVVTPWGVNYPFPREEERAAINESFQKLFDTIESYNTNQGVALREPSSSYNGKHERESSTVQDKTERSGNAAAESPAIDQGQTGDLFVGYESEKTNKLAKARYETSAVLTPVAEREIGATSVNTPEEAATALSYLARNGMERLDALITDEDGKPLAIIGNFKGTIDGASIYPRVLVGEAMGLEGAENIWIAHNHPSGIESLSHADKEIAKKIGESFRGTRIKMRGLMAIAGQVDGPRQFEMTIDGSQEINKSYAAPKESHKAPVMERILQRTNSLGAALSSPSMSKSAVKSIAGNQPGILLMDNRHRPVAFVPWSAERAGKLRGTGALDDLYEAAAKANAAAAIIANPDGSYDDRTIGNLGGALQKGGMEIRVLDAISYDSDGGGTPVSHAEGGKTIAEDFFFFHGDDATTDGLSKEDAQAAIDKVTGGWRNAPEVIVLESFDDQDIPHEAVRAENKYLDDGGVKGRTRGFFLNGKVYLIASNIPNAEQARVTLKHEALGHYGLRGLNADRRSRFQLKRVLEDIIEARPEQIKKKIAEYKIDPNDKFAEYRAAEELLAVMAQTEPNVNFVRRVVEIIKNLLRRIGKYNGKMTDKEIIANYIMPARKFVERGRKQKSGMDGIAFEYAGSEDSKEFKDWAGTSDVIEPSVINDTDFSGPGPYVMRVYHGTTHEFEEFDASQQGNKGGQFGAVNYFTSSEHDASQNYTSYGADLEAKIARRAEELTDDVREFPDWYGLNPNADYHDYEDVAIEKAREELAGDDDIVLELYVRTENPFVVGDDSSPWIEFADFDSLETEAIERVADNEGVEISEIEASRDDYDDKISEARWEIESETESPLLAAIKKVAEKYRELDAESLFDSLADYALEGTTQAKFEEALRNNNEIVYAEDANTGENAGSNAIADIIQELGFDSIILKNADERFKGMNMEPGVAHVHVFDANNTNVKSATDNVGTFDPNDPRIAFHVFGSTPTYYSQMGKAIEEKMALQEPAKSLALKLGGWVKKGFFKQDELEWSGLREWLNDQDGKVTREQVADFLAANNIQIEEVEKGAVDEGEVEAWWTDEGGANEETPYSELTPEEQRAAIQQYRDDVGDYSEDSTKFKDYQLPGGEDYRELLLTLPEKGLEWQKRGNVWTAEGLVGVSIELLPNQKYRVNEGAGIISLFNSLGEAKAAITRSNLKHRNASNYKSGHYDEPNILAHVRFNTRIDADGKRVLFIEEIQSDWHQMGRKQGYKTKTLPEGLSVVERGNSYIVQNKRGLVVARDATRQGAIDAVLTNKGKVPNAPFKTTWPLLAMKRMIRHAAENGYDRIAWTTGEQQADRYDLSKQVEALKLFNHGDGNWDISATQMGGGLVDIATRIPESKLADNIGKDLAKKAVETQPDRGWHTYSGLDLKVGGEGMIGFYDNMLPKMVNKYVKKWGARVGQTEFTGEGVEADIMNGVEAGTAEDVFTAHSVDVTDDMRDSAMEGQPMFHRGAAAADAATQDEGAVLTEETKREEAQRKIQDKMNRFTKAAKATGRDVTDEIDVRAAETLMYGREQERMELAESKFLEPIRKLLKKYNLKQEQVDEYLLNRHAEEANDYLAAQNPDLAAVPHLDRDSSGISTRDARAYLAGLSADERAKFEEIAAIVYRMNRTAVKVREAAGLLDTEVANEWLDRFEAYVPLKTLEDNAALRGSGTQGFEVKGPESKRRKGRGSVADNPLAHSMAQMEEAIRRASKAEVMSTFDKFAESNQDLVNEDGEQVFEKWTPPMMPDTGVSLTTGEVETYLRRNNLIPPDVVRVKKNGKFHYWKVNDPLILHQIKNLGEAHLTAWLKYFGMFSRFTRMLKTSLNPDFWLTNLTRDVQAGGINAATDAGWKHALRTMGNIFRYMPALWMHHSGKRGTSPSARLVQDFLLTGGATGYYRLRNVDGAKDYLNGKKPLSEVLSNLPLLKQIDAINYVMENSVRLAVYKAGLDSGMSKRRAGALAKDATVNFNKKGEWSSTLGAFYDFLNPSVQGINRAYRAATTKRGMAIGASIFGSGVFMALMHASAGDDEDTGQALADTLGDWERDQNLSFMIGDDKVTIPLAYAYNIPYTLGYRMTMAMMDNRWGKHMAALSKNIVGQLDPLNMGAGRGMPSVLGPYMEIERNENYFGGKVMPRKYDDATPDSQLAWKNTPEIYKMLATTANRLSGGDAYDPGAIDVSPNSIEHYIEWIGGGTLRTFFNVSDIVPKIVRGEETEKKRWPIFRRYVKDLKSEGQQAGRYYEVSDKLDVISNKIEDKAEGYRELKKKYRKALRYYEGTGKSGENDAKLRLYRWRKKLKSLKAKGVTGSRVERLEKRIRSEQNKVSRMFADAER